MNLFVEEKKLDFFLEKLKENDNIDDFILDKVQFGKQKINLNLENRNEFEIFTSLYNILPEKSIVTFDNKEPENDYFLCIGEIKFENINILEKFNVKLAIITKKEKNLRINFWIRYVDLKLLFDLKLIKNLCTPTGVIKNYSKFIFETKSNNINTLYNDISIYSDEVIIKDNKIYVNLLLNNFTKLCNKINLSCLEVQLVD